ncbi:DUF6894 family protein [Methylorubrum podarium]|nr:hypothetical protein CHKEEEPN_1672 [Methylorubrum podarium]
MQPVPGVIETGRFFPNSFSRMPRYFFDINDGTDLKDEVGREIQDPLALRREALRVMTTLMAAEAEDSQDCTLVLTVRNGDGDGVMTIRLVCQIDDG